MRQVKIRGGYVLRRGFRCRKEDMNKLYFDHVMSTTKEKAYVFNSEDIKRIISFLKRWQTRNTPLHETRVRIRANAHSILRETNDLTYPDPMNQKEEK